MMMRSGWLRSRWLRSLWSATRALALVLLLPVASLATARPVSAQAPSGVQVGVLRQDAPVRLGISLQPDTVTVGDPFIVSVRVQAPLGAAIEFPENPDSTFAIQALDPVQVSESPDSTVVDRTARYRVAAWDTGLQPVTFQPVTVRTENATRRLAVENVVVFVSSVLPADSAEHVPRPARDPFEFPGPWWLPWLLALLIASLVGLLLWWLWRRRRRQAEAIVVDPFRDAEEAFERIESMRLIDAGERSRYVALVTEVIRDYLAARDPAAAVSLTTRELVSALNGSRIVPVDRLHAVLRDADLVKFANRPPSEVRAREIGAESRALVRHIEDARTATIVEAAEEAKREAGRSSAREAA